MRTVSAWTKCRPHNAVKNIPRDKNSIIQLRTEGKVEEGMKMRYTATTRPLLHQDKGSFDKSGARYVAEKTTEERLLRNRSNSPTNVAGNFGNFTLSLSSSIALDCSGAIHITAERLCRNFQAFFASQRTRDAAGREVRRCIILSLSYGSYSRSWALRD